MNYDVLRELGPATSFVTDVLVTKWGSEVVVLCLYDPFGVRRPYQLLFRGCTDVQWEVTHPEDVTDSEADIIGFSIGVEDNRNLAVLHTDVFELLITYGSFTVRRNW